MDKKQKQRTIIFYKDYFEEFFVKQREKVKAKIVWTFDLVEDLEKVPETYLKPSLSNLWANTVSDVPLLLRIAGNMDTVIASITTRIARRNH